MMTDTTEYHYKTLLDRLTTLDMKNDINDKSWGVVSERLTALEDKGVEKVIVETISPMLDRINALEDRIIGHKNDIVLLTQENSQMFERITALEKHTHDEDGIADD